MAGDLENMAANDDPPPAPVFVHYPFDGAVSHGAEPPPGAPGVTSAAAAGPPPGAPGVTSAAAAGPPPGGGDRSLPVISHGGAHPRPGGGGGGGGPPTQPPGAGGGSHGPSGAAGGPVLMAPPYGSNMVVSGPAIIQQPPTPMLWPVSAACPSCGRPFEAHGHDDHHKEEKEPNALAGRVPAQWHVPQGIVDELSEIQGLINRKKANMSAIGACRILLQRLLQEFREPEKEDKKQPHPLAAFFLGERRPAKPPGPEKPKTPILDKLKQARKDGEITQGLLDAAERLQLDRNGPDVTASPQQYLNFLVELADAHYAHKSRLA